MATLIVLKNSKISGDNPTKLYPGELAINIADGNLYYGDANSVAHLLDSGGGTGVTQITAGSNITISPVGGTGNVTINAAEGDLTPPGGSNTQIQYNNAGAFGGVSNLTWNGTTLSATGSFTGSFTGSLQGTSSYVLTASYASNGGVTSLIAGSGISLSPAIGKGDVTISSLSAVYNTMTGSYGSFYDTGSVLATSATTIYSMSLNVTDISNGVFISASAGNTSRIKFTNAGVYDIQFSAQFSNTDNATQDAVIWIRKNGTDISDSAGTVGIPPFKAGSNGQALASWNYFLNVSANDYIQMCWNVEEANVITLETIPAGISPIHPRTPSLILTANRVDTFLSNTGSFSGSFTGQFTGSLFGTSSWANNAETSSFITGSNVYGPFGSNSILSSSFAVSSSRAVSSSYSISSSYAVTASYALNGGGGSTPAFPYTGSALITGSLGVTGSFSTTADALINGLTIGRGGGNTSTNTALGYQALSSSAAGNNIAIGYQAGKYQTGDASTIIGTYQAPDLANFNISQTLNIGKQGLPHFWAPPTLRVNPASSQRVLEIDSTTYSAAFIDYNLEDGVGAMRAGTLKVIWKIDGTYKLTEEATDSIGNTIKYYFTTSISGGVFKVNLFNDDASTLVRINCTCRLLIRPS